MTARGQTRLKTCPPGQRLLKPMLSVVDRNSPCVISENAKEKNQHNLFITNLPQVFQYCMKDVLETLNTLDMDVLNHIHKSLADRVKSDFCQYKDRRAVQRVVAHTAAKDMVIGTMYYKRSTHKRSGQNPDIITEQG